MSVLSFSTREQCPAARLDYWNGVMREVFRAPWTLEPLCPETFRMHLKAVSFGELMLTNATLSSARICNSPDRQTLRRQQRFALHFATRPQQVAMEGRETMLEPGDLVLTQSLTGCWTGTEDAYTTMALSFPGDMLRNYFPNPERVLGVRFSGREGLSRTVSTMLRSMWDLAEGGQMPELGGKLAGNLLELFATCCFMAGKPEISDSTGAQIRRRQIKRHIDDNLRDPDLTVEAVAAAFDVSSRYLQMLFSAERDTISAYIRRHRLEACRKQLLDPVWRDRTITEIAFGWGFNNAAHFARAFRNQYGMSAREARRGR